MKKEPIVPSEKPKGGEDYDIEEEDWTEREPVKKQFVKYDKLGNKIDTRLDSNTAETKGRT